MYSFRGGVEEVFAQATDHSAAIPLLIDSFCIFVKTKSPSPPLPRLLSSGYSIADWKPATPATVESSSVRTLSELHKTQTHKNPSNCPIGICEKEIAPTLSSREVTWNDESSAGIRGDGAEIHGRLDAAGRDRSCGCLRSSRRARHLASSRFGRCPLRRKLPQKSGEAVNDAFEPHTHLCREDERKCRRLRRKLTLKSQRLAVSRRRG